MKPRLLDLFCGAGGCSVGYARAGFDVTGVDIEPHPDYLYELIVADAMTVLQDASFLAGFNVIHASPPCPRFSAITPDPEAHADLLTPTLEALRANGAPWVIENVPGAPVPNAVLICGQAMGLRAVRRHRLFGSDLLLMSPGCGCSSSAVYGIYGDHGDKTVRGFQPGKLAAGRKPGVKARSVAHAQQLMGIDWMQKWDDLADAIPPVYTEFIGAQLIDQLAVAA